MTTIEKTLSRDKERVIQAALREMMKDNDSYPYVIELDEDKSEAYFEMWTEESGYQNWMVTYQLNADNTSATITSEPVQVVPQTEYKVISKSQEDGIVGRVIEGIMKHFGGTKRQVILKQFEEEEMLEVAPLFIGFTNGTSEIDGHGDAYASEEEVYKMVQNFNEALNEGFVQANKFHKEPTTEFRILKAWVNECDCHIGENFIPEGQPIVKVQYLDKEAWQKRKSGEYGGYSIGCKAEVIEVE